MIKKFLGYLLFWKKNEEADIPSTFNLKIMHGINRISILMFLVAVIVMIIRLFFR